MSSGTGTMAAASGAGYWRCVEGLSVSHFCCAGDPELPEMTYIRDKQLSRVWDKDHKMYINRTLVDTL